MFNYIEEAMNLLREIRDILSDIRNVYRSQMGLSHERANKP